MTENDDSKQPEKEDRDQSFYYHQCLLGEPPRVDALRPALGDDL